MHPILHRGLRELYATARRQREHWRALAGRLEASAPEHAELLHAGSSEAGRLLGELADATVARGVFGRPLAQGLGAQLAALKGALLDPALEVNQALRFALLDVVHVVALLELLARAAAREPDAELQALLDGWAARMRAHEDGLRAAVAALGDDPDRAVVPATPGLAGRIGHGGANALGTFGEWFDRRSAR